MAIALLVVIWFAAAFGAAFKIVSFDRADGLGFVLYVALGWTGLAMVPA